jgi:hypothetical protein
VYYSRWVRPLRGWYWPYPETTGYVIATLIRYARFAQEPRLIELALRQAEWIASLQYPDGALPGSHVDRAGKKAPSVFNTGQMLIGLCAAHDVCARDGTFRVANDRDGASCAPASGEAHPFIPCALRAARWLARGVDPQAGIWTGHAYVQDFSPSYYAHACWPMLEVWRRTGEDGVRDAACRVLDTIIRRQRANAAFDGWGFRPGAKAFTHTIGYTLWGLLEAARVLGPDGQRYADAALRTGGVLLRKAELQGGLAGAYDPDWRGDRWYACLTGHCQVAQAWMRAAELLDDLRYLNAACKALRAVIDAQRIRSLDPNLYGAIPGSRPLWGRYLAMRYPNWAPKFFVDALLDADAWMQRLNDCGSQSPAATAPACTPRA